MKKGLNISEYGVFREPSGRRIAGATEEEVYAAVGLPWIPPELREDAGEIEAAPPGASRTSSSSTTSGATSTATPRRRDGHHTIDALVTAAARGATSTSR